MNRYGLSSTASAVLIALCAPATGADAQGRESYPTRPIHIVVPFPPGGPADIIARIIGQRMTQDWGQAVIVENRSGANTVIGAAAVARAVPDGYTLLMAIDSTLVMNQFLYRTPPYDPFADFAPITTVTQTVSVVAVRARDGANSVKDLMAQARAAPGKLNYGAGALTSQLMGYLFHKAAGLDIVYVPFKGTEEAKQGLLTGSVDVIYVPALSVNPLVEAGKVRELAKLDSRTPAALAAVPTLSHAAGLPLDDISVWLGLVAPAATPRPIIDTLWHEVERIMNDPDVAKKSELTGGYPMTMSPEAFAAFMRREADRWKPVLKQVGLRYD